MVMHCVEIAKDVSVSSVECRGGARGSPDWGAAFPDRGAEVHT